MSKKRLNFIKPSNPEGRMFHVHDKGLDEIRIRVDGMVQTFRSCDEWMDDFVEWLENRAECFGGGINEMVEEDEDGEEEMVTTIHYSPRDGVTTIKEGIPLDEAEEEWRKIQAESEEDEDDV